MSNMAHNYGTIMIFPDGETEDEKWKIDLVLDATNDVFMEVAMLCFANYV